MRNIITNLSIGKKIGGGFSIVVLLIAVLIVSVFIRTNESEEINNRVFELRTPTVLASTHILNGIN